MTCNKCAAIVESPDVPHVVRKCEGCGRPLRIREPGPHGIGLQIRAGDEVVIPGGWMTFSLNPLKSRGQFTRHGLSWFAEAIHLDRLPKKKEDIGGEIGRLQSLCDEALKASPLLAGLSLDDEEDAHQVFDVLEKNRGSAEWWWLLQGTFLSVVRDAMDKGDVQQAVWAMGCAERCRSMVVFKENLEEVVWMGHSAKRVVDLLRTWDANKENSDEGFWQATFRESSYALSQVLAVPVVFVREAAYVGGMNVDRKEARLVDYLLSMESSREAVLVEIKTPTTRLLGRAYRGIRGPSADLSGALAQVLDYRVTLMGHLKSITDGTAYDITAFSPRCVLIAGNGRKELNTAERRRHFEQFRANSRDVEIVTYDELFRKLEILANLFSLVRTSEAATSTRETGTPLAGLA